MGNPTKTTLKPSENLVKLPENPEKPKKNLGGRPRKTELSETARRNQDIFNRALSYQDRVGKDNITISGMARELGYLDARDMVERAQRGEGGVRMALSLCEEKYERLLGSKNFAGASIALKQLGWKETQYIQQENKTVTVQVNLAATLDDLSKVLRPMEEQDA